MGTQMGLQKIYVMLTMDCECAKLDVTAYAPVFGTIVTDTHNDQDYTDPAHPARRNLDCILESIRTLCDERQMQPVGVTLEALCDFVRSG